MNNRRTLLKASVLATALATIGVAHAADTIKVGILHSLSDTMAISETALMAIDEINKSGGVLGKKLEPVVTVTFGCWTSVSRKSVLPVYKELNGLLFCPLQYEGEGLEKSVFYTGAAPNQQAIPAVELVAFSVGEEAKKQKLPNADKVIAAMAGQTFKAPSSIVSMMDEKNHHLHKSVFIGKVKADSQFNVAWKTPGPIRAQPWNPYIEGNDKKKDVPEGM